MKDKYKTLITACWIVLICFFIVKLLGGNWFEIACNNENFISFCDLIGIKTLQYYSLSMFTSLIANGLIVMSILKEKIGKNKITLIVLVSLFCLNIFKFLFDKYLPITFLLTIIDLCMLIVLPIILNYKNWKRTIVGVILTLIFQIISLVTKNLGIKNIDDNVLTSLIFMIDYYIMLLLYYLYSTREELKNGSICSIFSRFRKRRND